MFQNRIFRKLWGKKKKDSTKFIFKPKKKKNHKTSAGILGCLNGFKESQFPDSPGQEYSQNREARVYILMHKQSYYKGLQTPTLRSLFNI